MKLDKRTTTVLGVAIIAILLMLSGFFIINPSIATQKELSEELKTAQQQSEDYQAQIIQLESVRENINIYEEQDSDLTKKFPSQADIELLLNDITKAGNDAGVSEITRIQTNVPEVVISESAGAGEAPPADAEAEASDPAEPNAAQEPQSSDLAIMGLTLTAEGSEGSLRDYATALTQMPRSFLIESITISCENTCTLTAAGTTYLYRPTLSPNQEEEQPVEGQEVVSDNMTTEG